MYQISLLHAGHIAQLKLQSRNEIDKSTYITILEQGNYPNVLMLLSYCYGVKPIFLYYLFVHQFAPPQIAILALNTLISRTRQGIGIGFDSIYEDIH